MTYETKIHNKKILVGHLYDISEEYLSTFFQEGIRLRKNMPRFFLVPGRLLESTVWPSFFISSSSNINVTKIAMVNTVPPVPAPNLNKYYLDIAIKTLPGYALVVDEIRTGSKVVYYKTWLNGEERVFTKNQLLYAEEIK